MSVPDALLVSLQCAEAFEQVQVGYFLGGSLASSLQGEPRSTNDIDFVVDLRLSQVEPLAQTLGDDFDVDVESLKEAVAQRRSWNIFPLPTVTKAIGALLDEQGRNLPGSLQIAGSAINLHQAHQHGRPHLVKR